MPAENTVNKVVVDQNEKVIQTITEALPPNTVVRHCDNNVNINNNRAFAFLMSEDQVQELVEVVRRGREMTRIRRSLVANTQTELVHSNLLTGYRHLYRMSQD